MAAEQFIFVGFEMSDEIAVAMDQCRETDRVFFEDPTYLEIAAVDGRRLIGKRLKSGAPGDRLEDTARSVVSLLSRIKPGLQLAPDRAELLAGEIEVHAPTGEMFTEEDEAEEEEDE